MALVTSRSNNTRYTSPTIWHLRPPTVLLRPTPVVARCGLPAHGRTCRLSPFRRPPRAKDLTNPGASANPEFKAWELGLGRGELVRGCDVNMTHCDLRRVHHIQAPRRWHPAMTSKNKGTNEMADACRCYRPTALEVKGCPPKSGVSTEELQLVAAGCFCHLGPPRNMHLRKENSSFTTGFGLSHAPSCSPQEKKNRYIIRSIIRRLIV